MAASSSHSVSYENFCFWGLCYINGLLLIVYIHSCHSGILSCSWRLGTNSFQLQHFLMC